MTITSLPTRSSGSIGATKTNLRTPTGASHEHPAAEINAMLDAIVAQGAELGLTAGTTAGSLNARRKATVHAVAGTLAEGVNFVVRSGTVAMVLPVAPEGRFSDIYVILSDGGAGSITVQKDAGVTTAYMLESGATLSDLSAGVALPASDRDATAKAPTMWHLRGTTVTGPVEFWFLEAVHSAARLDAIARGYGMPATADGEVASITADHTVTTERLLFVDTSGGAVTIDVPDPANVTAGRALTVVKTTDDANTITIDVLGAGGGVAGETGAAADPYALPGSDDASRRSWELIGDPDTNSWYLRSAGSATAADVTTTTDPTTTDDTNAGREVGQCWNNTTGDRTWRAIDVTAAAALWRRTGGPCAALQSDAGTVALYTFDGNGNDSGGGGINLSAAGSPAFGHGIGGRQVFRGTSGNNYSVASATLDLSDDLCMEMMIFPRYAATAYIHTWAQYGPNATRRYFMDFDNASAGLLETGYWNGTTDVVIGTTILTEQWSYVCVTRVVDGGNTTISLYVNGQLAATDTRAGGPTTGSSTLYVGRNATGSTSQVLAGEYVGGLHLSTTVPTAAQIKQRTQLYLPNPGVGS